MVIDVDFSLLFNLIALFSTYTAILTLEYVEHIYSTLHSHTISKLLVEQISCVVIKDFFNGPLNRPVFQILFKETLQD